MGKTSFKIATSSLLALMIGAMVSATPAASQSLTDRFKSLFGGKSDEPPPPIVDNKGPAPDINCPPVGIRAGASTFAVAAPGKEAVGNDVRYQATITKTARECIKNGGEITARIGIQGRVIVGPAGAPTSVEVPLRIAVVQGGVSEKVLATKAYRTNVEIGEQDSVPFSLVVDDLVYPEPQGADGDKYIFYIGFDPQALAPEPKPKAGKKKK
ncbi:hypothetical protein [Bradyrhizobium sp. Tv2a-2]|uniref:hypothetical protein n=1 Tax=Bradyrhizobium sp. Tv2a-2 TaxID=113395 RepID=UPI00040179D1|nr:hypothetical protein [Bradyrhizobium sp. Tv2a-2]